MLLLISFLVSLEYINMSLGFLAPTTLQLKLPLHSIIIRLEQVEQDVGFENVTTLQRAVQLEHT